MKVKSLRRQLLGAAFLLLPSSTYLGPAFFAKGRAEFVLQQHYPGHTFQLSPRTCEAYQQVFELRFAEARATLAQMKVYEPENLLALLIENYLDFFTILIDDDKTAYKRQVKKMEPRLARLARGDRKSPWFLYAPAEIRLQWAMLRAKNKDYLSSLSDIKQAYALLKQNQREHPEFKVNLKSLGIIHALVGNVPEEYRWGMKALGGISGSVDQGLRELTEALHYAQQQNLILEDETRITCAFLQLHAQNDKITAWSTLTKGSLDARTSPIVAFALASLAMRTGRNDEAIRFLEACPEGSRYHPFPYRYLLLGMAKLNRLDSDAHQPLLQFIQTFKGETGLKEAYQKLGWYQLIMGNERGYHANMQQVKTKGNDRSEPDQAALREARRGKVPDVRLMRARLLFDGGYNDRAYALLQNSAADYQADEKNKLEYYYRLGRISDALGRTPDAIRLYTQTIDSGAGKPWYFACSAALYLGMLHEQTGAFNKARTAYQRCLEIKPDEYAAGLHARAKAGLNRLKRE